MQCRIFFHCNVEVSMYLLFAKWMSLKYGCFVCLFWKHAIRNWIISYVEFFFQFNYTSVYWFTPIFPLAIKLSWIVLSKCNIMCNLSLFKTSLIYRHIFHFFCWFVEFSFLYILLCIKICHCRQKKMVHFTNVSSYVLFKI